MQIVLNTWVWDAESYMLPCLNKELFGFDCPGCGLQRAALLLLQGDFVAAFKMYPAIYSLLILMGFLLLNTMLKFKYDFKIKLFFIFTSVLFIIVSYILKMINLTH